VTLSPPVRVLALVGALALTGLAAFLFLVGRGSQSGVPSTSAVVIHSPSRQAKARAGTQAGKPATPAVHQTRIALVPGLPDGIADALRVHRFVIVTVYVPGASVDAFVRSEAQAASATTRAGYVGVSARSETALARLVAKTGVLPDPAVVIMRRPGTVATTLGIADRETIAQAVLQARGRR
jgi:hypothetical protein